MTTISPTKVHVFMMIAYFEHLTVVHVFCATCPLHGPLFRLPETLNLVGYVEYVGFVGDVRDVGDVGDVGDVRDHGTQCSNPYV